MEKLTRKLAKKLEIPMVDNSFQTIPMPIATDSMYLFIHSRSSYERRKEMAEKVKQLPDDALTDFVHFVQQSCPKAVINNDDKGLQVDINNMDNESFVKIMAVIDSKLEESAKSPLKKFKANN